MDNDILDGSRLIKRFQKRNDVQIYGEEYDECKESFESMTAEICKYIVQPETKACADGSAEKILWKTQNFKFYFSFF